MKIPAVTNVGWRVLQIVLLPTKVFATGTGEGHNRSHLRSGGELGELFLLVGGLSRAAQRLAVHPRF